MNDETTMTARGSSMFPFVPPGSRLRLVPRARRRIAVGDIVCYPGAGSRVVAHRVAEILPGPGGTRYRIRADFEPPGELVDAEAIAWVVTRVDHSLLRYDTDSVLARLMSRAVLEHPRLYMGGRTLALWAVRLRRGLFARNDVDHD